jgi:hypothetical protein
MDKSLNKSAVLRLEQQAKERERLAAAPKKKAGITYTSNRNLHKWCVILSLLLHLNDLPRGSVV